MSVTVVSCVYGPTFAGFIPRWLGAVKSLDPAPDRIVVASDRPHEIPGATVVVSECHWKHPQAWHLNQAVSVADTDWVWFVDIDDVPLADGIDGLDDVDADVWQLGYVRSDGRETHLPSEACLAAPGNLLTAGSAVRGSAFFRVGGFPDVAFQDWALWRKLHAAGASFAFSGRVHYRYMRHLSTRSEMELKPRLRAFHVAEMEACLAA